MPWTCPACQTSVEHSDLEKRPRPHVVYRCHVCHLELLLDLDAGKLTITPLLDVEPAKSPGR
jgi:hypothetical protein